MDKANVSDKDKGDLADVENNAAKKKMDEKRDEQREKMEHESEGNRIGNSDLMFLTYATRMFHLGIFILRNIYCIRRQMCSG